MILPLSQSSPQSTYAARQAARLATASALGARLDTLSYARLAAFALALTVAGLAFGAQLYSPWFALLPVLLFIWLVAKFEMTRGRKAWAERAAKFYASGLARLEGKPGGVSDGSRFADDSHAYAADLDLFGPGSVFERVTACRTHAGEETLAAWLLAPATPPEIALRQEAVADLIAKLDLRESLAVAGADVPATDYGSLAEWGVRPEEPVAPWKRHAVEFLGWANVLAWADWLFFGVSGLSALLVMLFGLLSFAIALPLLGWAQRVLAPLDRATANLSLLEAVLGRLERETFTATRLRELQAAMKADGHTASEQIRALRLLLDGYNARRNAFFMPVAVLRMWNVRFAFKLEAWRATSGPAIANWLRAVGQAEALSSLAGYAFENPTDIFPRVETGEVRLTATGVGHPLIPAAKCVRNDVSLGGETGPRVLIISGSNMSGKSTLLRAVGVNTVLALAGGVVRATAFTLTPIALGATMRVQDSLQAGRSRFFAEVTKVRLLLDISTRKNGPPLFFLLDELFAGTNSADRVAGAEGVIRALLAAHAIGFVTTHDLSLTAVTDQIPGAVNVHFCDGFAGGELNFDYTMRPGVVPHGNGLALMRAVGLKV